MNWVILDVFLMAIITIFSTVDFYFTVVNNKKHIVKFFKKVKRKIKRKKPRAKRTKPTLKLVSGGNNE